MIENANPDVVWRKNWNKLKKGANLLLNKHNSYLCFSCEWDRANKHNHHDWNRTEKRNRGEWSSVVRECANATVAIVGTLLLHIYHENICWPRPRRVTHGSQASFWLVNAPCKNAFTTALCRDRTADCQTRVLVTFRKAQFTVSLTIILHFHLVAVNPSFMEKNMTSCWRISIRLKNCLLC